MERDKTSGEQQSLRSLITLPQRALVVLSGPAGAGKSTFAQRVVKMHKDQGLQATTIVSSDYCRALVCDDEANQHANRDTFDLFHYIIHKRMYQNRFTIADSTALLPEARRRLLEVARQHRYTTCLLIFNISPEMCTQRDRKRERVVGEQVIAYHIGLLQQTLIDAPKEEWEQMHILREQDLAVPIEICTRPC